MNYEDALRKAMACLRLAKSSNEHEAALAASRAQEIIDRYKLDISNLDFTANSAKEDSEPIRDFGYDDPLDVAKYGNGRETWCVRLGSIVARQNQCRILFYKDAKRNSVIKILGRASDVTAVRYLYGFFKTQIETIGNEKCAGHSAAFRGQFFIGMTDTLYRRLTEQAKATRDGARAEQGANPLALVQVNNAIARLERRAGEVDKFIESEFGDTLRSSRAGHARVYTGGRSAGQQAGNSIRLTSAKGGITAGRKTIGQ